ncbi:ribosomal RNA processing protein 7 [Suhomyces tanzawaensis NRRL Y-17324]|uniref:Ribosomal RNA processing protein 7 n=1 Tax=Suhomyces tanzawaensis NRRL Y-17324 TaxID=984487 RepID=A0A1E4SFT2_9ASCO|nr:ribosomal RNA processing protein 7 [Suhomyces tanzawaensis NRRL Y-17324]ODV78371.1 ribosomal RNA processing protein 7 [Suhomyces tanzawaensis NRRL Y-17324]
MPKDIKGFTVLPIVIGGDKAPEAPTHYIYVKKHDSKGSTDNRSLFICNVPIETEISAVRKYFQETAIGATVEEFVPSLLTDYPEDIWVNLTKLTSDLEVNPEMAHLEESGASKLPKNCGIVTFVDKSACQLAYSALKKLASSEKTSQWPAPLSTSASVHYATKYRNQILDTAQLSLAVAQSLVDFEKAEQESYEALQQQTQLVDEDGFTLVVGSHRKTKAGVLGKQQLTNSAELAKAQAKMKKKEKEDFYRFQLRQRKKEEMNDLLQKFKADQDKVRVMREKKRFRPY